MKEKRGKRQRGRIVKSRDLREKTGSIHREQRKKSRARKNGNGFDIKIYSMREKEGEKQKSPFLFRWEWVTMKDRIFSGGQIQDEKYDRLWSGRG